MLPTLLTSRGLPATNYKLVNARHVQAAREKHQANLLIGAHYMNASLMAFYLPDQPQTFLLPEPYGASQFSLWPGYQKDVRTRALYVRNASQTRPPTLSAEFSNVTLVDQFWSLHQGRPMSEFQIFLCTSEASTNPPAASKVGERSGPEKSGN